MEKVKRFKAIFIVAGVLLLIVLIIAGIFCNVAGCTLKSLWKQIVMKFLKLSGFNTVLVLNPV